MIHTFDVADILTACRRHPAIATALRPETVAKENVSRKNGLADLASDNVALTSDMIRAIAQLCRLSGLSETSSLKHLEHLVCISPHCFSYLVLTRQQVSDIIQGWRLHIEPQTSTEWASQATTWFRALCGHSAVSLELEIQLKMTFLHAVQAGLGDFNMLHDSRLIIRVCCPVPTLAHPLTPCRCSVRRRAPV